VRSITISQLVDDAGAVARSLGEEDGVLLTDNDGGAIGVLVHQDEYALMSEVSTLVERPEALSSLVKDQESERQERRTVPYEKVFFR
jgi:hypothetical protein